MNIETLTKKELELYNDLIFLGDSEEIAYKTVIEERKTPDNSEEYYKAYCL